MMTTTAAVAGAATGRRPAQKVGKGEGKLNLVAWVGYVEDGSTDPSADWVTPFEKETGCQVSVKIGATSDEMVQLMRTGQYDGVSASGDASARLVEGGDVDPVNVDLVPNYKDIVSPRSRTSRTTRSTARSTAIPHGRGSNLLALQDGRRQAGAEVLGRGVRRERARTRARSPRTTTRSTSRTRRCT